MFKGIAGSFITIFALLFLAATPAQAQQHRATRLGNPATRFANPLRTPEDLRNMLRSEALRTDVDFIAKESGYHGNLEDLRHAAATNNILPLKIPVGTRLPAMSSRKNGKAILLRDVLWAGKEPIDAYEFYFASRERRYRLVAPKACANFWVEDLGKELRPALALDCNAPNEVALGRPAQVCLTTKNIGDDIEPLATLTLPIPDGATFASATAGGKLVGNTVTWELPNLAVGSSNQVCAMFGAPQLGQLSFVSTARGQRASPVQNRCETRIIGIPAILLEVVDLSDPIEVGSDVTYEITVLNQGTAALTNIELACTMEESQQFISGTGTTAVQAQDRTITLEKLPALHPKEKAAWRVIAKALAPGDVRFTTELTCQQFQKPVREAEATQQY